MKKNLLYTLLAGGALLTASATAAVISGTRGLDPAPQTIDLMGTLPANNATVKSVSTLKVLLGNDAVEAGLAPIEERYSNITITKDGETESAAKVTEMKSDALDYDLEAYVIEFDLDKEITEAGTYTITVPKGTFAEQMYDAATDSYVVKPAGNESAAYTAKFTVDPAMKGKLDTYILKPADKEKVTSIEKVLVNYPELPIMSMIQADENAEISITNGTVTYTGETEQDWNFEFEDGATMGITFIGADKKAVVISEPGEWTLTIPAGTYTLDGDKSPAMTAKFTIVAPAEPFEITKFTPENESKVKSVTNIKAYLPLPADGSFVQYGYSQEDIEEMYLTYKDGETTKKIYLAGPGDSSLSADETYQIAVLELQNPLTAAGEYTLVIPEGTYFPMDPENDGQPLTGAAANAKSTLTFTIDPTLKDPMDDYKITPASGPVASISSINILFPQLDPSLYLYNSEEGSISITNGTTTYAGAAVIDWNYEEEMGKSFNISFFDAEENPVTIKEPGKWTLKINAGAFTVEDQANQQITAEYEIIAYTLDPASGHTFTDMPEITLSFPQATKVEFIGSNSSFNMSLGQKWAAPGFECTEVKDATVPTFKLTLPEGMSTPSLYLYNSEEGSISITNGTTTYAGAAVIDWNYEEEMGKSFNISFFDAEENPVTIKEPGKWTLKINAGAFTVEDQANQQITAEYEIIAYTLDPASGHTFTDMPEITLSFPQATKVEFIGSNSSFNMSLGQKWAAPGFECTEVKDATVPTFKLTLPEGMSTPPNGVLAFFIDEEAFLIDGVKSPEIRATYYMDRDIPQTVTYEPNLDDIVLQSFGYNAGFHFDEAASFARTAKFYDSVEVKLGDEKLTKTDYEIQTVEGNSCVFCITNEDFWKPGKLSISLKGEGYTLSGQPGFDVAHTWNVVEPKTYTYTLTPDGKTDVESLDEIIVAFPEAKTGELYQQSFISFKNTNYEWLWVKDVTPVADAECATFKITFDTAGIASHKLHTYTLEINKGCFTLDGAQESPQISQKYTYIPAGSGVGEFEAADNGKYNVYTIDGKVVLKNAEADQLKSLNNGLYIINGKKTIIR